MYGPSFKSVGAKDSKAYLKDMVFGSGETSDVLLMIDPATAAYTELIYLNDADAKDLVGEDAVAGWYLDEGNDVFTYKGNDEISLGCGFWVEPFTSNVDVTAAGEVSMTFERTLPAYLYSAFANPFPMTVRLDKFTFSGAETSDVMLLIDKTDASYTELIYLNEVDAKDLVGEDAVAGWYLDEGDDVFTYKGAETLEAGQGCWIEPFTADVTVSATL